MEENEQKDIKEFIEYVINNAPYKINTIFVNFDLLQNYVITLHDQDIEWNTPVLKDCVHFLQCPELPHQETVSNQNSVLHGNSGNCNCSDVRDLFAKISSQNTDENSFADTYSNFASIYNHVELGVLTNRCSPYVFRTPTQFISDKSLSLSISIKHRRDNDGPCENHEVQTQCNAQVSWHLGGREGGFIIPLTGSSNGGNLSGRLVDTDKSSANQYDQLLEQEAPLDLSQPRQSEEKLRMSSLYSAVPPDSMLYEGVFYPLWTDHPIFSSMR